MKDLLRISACLLLTALLTTVLVGCSGGQEDRGGSEVDINAEIQNLKNSDATARQNACVELAKAGPRSAPAVNALMETLKDQDTLVRSLAAYALGEIGDAAKPAIPTLKEMMEKDPEASVAASCLNALRVLDPASVSAVGMPTP